MRRVGPLGFSASVSPAGPREGLQGQGPLDAGALRPTGHGARCIQHARPRSAREPEPTTPSLAWSIDDRLRHAGARKGRVLAVWQGETLVAACAWHLHETGPPVIFDLGARLDLPARQQLRVCTALLACLRDIAHELAAHPMNCAGATARSSVCPTRANVTATARRSALAPPPCTSSRCAPDPSFWKGRWAVKRSF